MAKEIKMASQLLFFVILTLLSLKLGTLATAASYDEYDYYGPKSNTERVVPKKQHSVELLVDGQRHFFAQVGSTNAIEMGFKIYVSHLICDMFIGLNLYFMFVEICAVSF